MAVLYTVSGITEVLWRAAAAVIISEGDLNRSGFWPEVSLHLKILYNVMEITFYLDQTLKSCDLS